jgi:hypothetical protein
MRTFLPLLLLLAACPEQAGLQCPPNTSIVGQYALAFTANHDAGECVAQTDAGTIPLALDDAGVKASTLCVGSAADGGTQLQLFVPTKGVLKSDLLADGGFHFPSNAGVTPDTACICDVDVSETLDGYLLTTGPFSLRPDGGLPPITGLTATLALHLSAAASDCSVCNLPCTASYAIAGSPF